MTDATTPQPRDLIRTRLVEVAAGLLAGEGPDAVTTRSVAQAAGVQAPVIYRLFGDKDGLLEAVAEHGFLSYMAQKGPVDAGDDPVANLHAGWVRHVGFGLANPALFRLMHTTLRTSTAQTSLDAGADILRERVHRVAQAGRLRVSEERAVEFIRAAGTGVVFTLIDQPPTEAAGSLADLAWQSIRETILVDTPAAAAAAPPAQQAAITLRAALPGLTAFTPAERVLLSEWLDRVAVS